MATAALADKAAGRHHSADMGAAAGRAIRLFFTENQTFEVLVTVFTMIFIYRHDDLLASIDTAFLLARTASSCADGCSFRSQILTPTVKHRYLCLMPVYSVYQNTFRHSNVFFKNH
jgi:hypothetical protein